MSKNVQLLGSYLSEGATAASTTGSASGYDVQSVVGLDRSVGWKAPSSATVRLSLNLGSAKTPTGVGLVGGNWSEWGTTLLRYSSDGSSWTTLLTLTGFPADEFDFFSALAGAPSRQYWALEWSAPSAAPELAVFYLGLLTELHENPQLGMGNRDVYNVAEERAASGSIQAEEFGRRVERLVMAFTGTTAQRNTLRDFLRTERGPRRTFFYIPRDDSGSGTSGQALLGRCTAEFGGEEEITGAWVYGFTFREEA